MELNNSKFELITHKSTLDGRNLKLLEHLPFYNKYSTYMADSVEIKPSYSVKDLGIMVDETLNWKLQVDTVSKKCKQLSAWVLSVFYTRDKNTMLTLFKSLIRPKIEYCCEVWSPFLIKDIVKIEQVQSSFTHRIAGMSDYNYWERLQLLDLMSLQRRREKIVLTHLWKILNNIYPNTIEIEFKTHLRTQSIKAIIKPLPKLRGNILTKYDHSFTVNAAKLWNVMPSKLSRETTLSLFKANLDIYLHGIPDQPPLPGYPYQCDNSLVNISVINAK